MMLLRLRRRGCVLKLVALTALLYSLTLLYSALQGPGADSQDPIVTHRPGAPAGGLVYAGEPGAPLGEEGSGGIQEKMAEEQRWLAQQLDDSKRDSIGRSVGQSDARIELDETMQGLVGKGLVIPRWNVAGREVPEVSDTALGN